MFSLSEACMAPVKPFAAFTLGRGVLEFAARALWLFDADIESGERVARGMSLRHQGLDSQRKLATLPAALNEHTDLDLDKIAGRVREMVTKADEEGVKTLRDRRQKVIGFGSGMLKRGELVRSIPDGEFDYRLFSAVCHSESWALIQVGFQKLDRENLVIKQGEPMNLSYVCVRSIEYFAQALWAQAHIYGWKIGPFARLLEETYDSLSLAPERRFWRRQPAVHM